MIHDWHPVHGLMIGAALYATGMTDMQTAILVGGGTTVYMLTFGHTLPF